MKSVERDMSQGDRKLYWQRWMAFMIVLCGIVAVGLFTACKKHEKTSNDTGQQPNIATQTEAQSTSQHAMNAEEQSCTVFVQNFYDWYVLKGVLDDCNRTHDAESCKTVASSHVVTTMSLKQALSPKLKGLLDKYEVVQTKNSDVGLDFDEFLNSQDPSPKFEVESVQVKDGHCDAVVNGIQDEQKRERIGPELVKSEGHWMFVNFHYYSDDGNKRRSTGDLIRMLKDYFEEMKNPVKQGAVGEAQTYPTPIDRPAHIC